MERWLFEGGKKAEEEEVIKLLKTLSALARDAKVSCAWRVLESVRLDQVDYNRHVEHGRFRIVLLSKEPQELAMLDAMAQIGLLRRALA